MKEILEIIINILMVIASVFWIVMSLALGIALLDDFKRRRSEDWQLREFMKQVLHRLDNKTEPAQPEKLVLVPKGKKK